MRLKTSISLPKELLDRIDGVEQNRSAFLAKAARAYIASLEREHRDVRDLEILNANADRLNAEARDVLDYQTGFRCRSGPTR
jgi:metal-responsive CopG/Arc/MetJ family transcriptional regulator